MTAEGARRCYGKASLNNLWSILVTGRSAQRLEESKYHSCLQEGQEEGPREPQAGQPHLDLWENDGATNSENHFQDKNIIRSNQHGGTKRKSCLTNMIDFYSEMTGLVDQGIAADIIY